jgi:hypothetical protein
MNFYLPKINIFILTFLICETIFIFQNNKTKQNKMNQESKENSEQKQQHLNRKSSDFKYFNEDKIPSELICCICKYVFVDPICHSECGNLFCKNCIMILEKIDQGKRTKHFDGITNCPLCIQPISVANCKESQKPLQSQLENLIIECPQCSQLCRRGMIQNHLFNYCLQHCTNNCGSRISRADQLKHNDSCPEFKVDCCEKSVGCPWNGTKSEFTKLHQTTCPYIQLGSKLHEAANALMSLKDQNINLLHSQEVLKSNNSKLRHVIVSNENRFSNFHESCLLLEKIKSSWSNMEFAQFMDIMTKHEAQSQSLDTILTLIEQIKKGEETTQKLRRFMQNDVEINEMLAVGMIL